MFSELGELLKPLVFFIAGGLQVDWNDFMGEWPTFPPTLSSMQPLIRRVQCQNLKGVSSSLPALCSWWFYFSPLRKLKYLPPEKRNNKIFWNISALVSPRDICLEQHWNLFSCCTFLIFEIKSLSKHLKERSKVPLWMSKIPVAQGRVTAGASARHT